MMNARGWAVILNGEIDVRSVAPTRRASVLNWLVLNGRLPLASISDAKIDQGWESAVRVTSRLRVSQVSIEAEAG